jgi:CubicO group peptidase (beta-lactamase class C family)
MPGSIDVQGQCRPQFARVKDAFAENFWSRGEVGAGVCVHVDGEPVVDLWGGWRDPARTTPWERDTLVCTQSVSKEVVALGLHMAVDRGLIGVDDLVSRYWPEFAQAGKEPMRVRWMLDHRSGVPIVDDAWHGMAYDWDAMIAGLSKTRPMWGPGSVACYLSANYGYLTGELLHRVTGKLPGNFVRDEITGPLGIEFCIGLRPDEEARVATFIAHPDHPVAGVEVNNPESLFARQWKIFHDGEDYNSPEWRHAQVPSTNGHTNAHSLARLCDMMAHGGELGGVRLISAAQLERAGQVQWDGWEIQGRKMAMSLGFILTTPSFPTTGPRSLGFAGAGGATAFADPEHRVAFGYAMNDMDTDLSKPRPRALIAALNACLA